MKKSARPYLPVANRQAAGVPHAGYWEVYGKQFPYSTAREQDSAMDACEEYGQAVVDQLLARAKREFGRTTLTNRELNTGQLTLPVVDPGIRSIVPQQEETIESQSTKRIYATSPWLERIAFYEKQLLSHDSKVRNQAEYRLKLLRVKAAEYDQQFAEHQQQVAHDESVEIVRARKAVQDHWEKVSTDSTSTTEDISHATELKTLASAPDVKAGNIWQAFKRLPPTVPDLLEKSVE